MFNKTFSTYQYLLISTKLWTFDIVTEQFTARCKGNSFGALPDWNHSSGSNRAKDWSSGKKIKAGSGCGSVGRAVTSNSRGLRFESCHQQKFKFNILPSTVLKRQNKEKEAGKGPFKKRRYAEFVTPYENWMNLLNDWCLACFKPMAHLCYRLTPYLGKLWYLKWKTWPIKTIFYFKRHKYRGRTKSLQKLFKGCYVAKSFWEIFLGLCLILELSWTQKNSEEFWANHESGLRIFS